MAGSVNDNYSYITLDEVVNNMIASLDPDDWIRTVKRHRLLIHARRGVREINYDKARTPKLASLEVDSTLSLTLPEDYVDFIRVSYVDDNGMLVRLATNDALLVSGSPEAEGLLDNEGNLLFDNTGDILLDQDGGGAPTGIASNPESNVNISDFGSDEIFYYRFSRFHPNLDARKIFPNGYFNIDLPHRTIQFSDNIESKTIVIEYISDGMFEDEKSIRIHKFAEPVLREYIYYNLIKFRRSVPANEKDRARRELKRSIRVCKSRLAGMHWDDLRQWMKGANRWIKG